MVTTATPARFSYRKPTDPELVGATHALRLVVEEGQPIGHLNPTVDGYVLRDLDGKRLEVCYGISRDTAAARLSRIVTARYRVATGTEEHAEQYLDGTPDERLPQAPADPLEGHHVCEHGVNVTPDVWCPKCTVAAAAATTEELDDEQLVEQAAIGAALNELIANDGAELATIPSADLRVLIALAQAATGRYACQGYAGCGIEDGHEVHGGLCQEWNTTHPRPRS